MSAHGHQQNMRGKQLYTMMLGAIGVVYGDIGTSPLYTLREAFATGHGLDFTETNILGVLSLLLWSLIITVSIKYVTFVMRADNRGEGGILALMALAHRALQKKSILITSIGLIGAALFYGDGMITPAISVLSAVEGLNIATHFFEPYVVWITLGIIMMLFAAQLHGTDLIGKLFGPVMILWFLVLGLLGVNQILHYPQVLQAFSPYYAMQIFLDNHWIGFLLLGTVVLAVTGVEALYADMGHFGNKPIRYAWLFFVMPCLMLNYLGQGALVLSTPEAISNPFYLLVPKWGLYPMVGLATLATVIASQAMISGAYSITQQAIQLGFLPRLKIEHTSAKQMGQIYMPNVNRFLFIGVCILVLWFHSSSALADAYGVAVTGTMLMTTLLITVVALRKWNWSLAKVMLIAVPFFLIDFAFFSATLMKLSHGIGAWVPLVLGLLIFMLMLTWHEGRVLKNRRLGHRNERITTFIKNVEGKKLARTKGTAIYMARDIEHVPLTLRMNVDHHHALHESVLLVSVESMDVPRVSESERVQVQKLNKGFWQIRIIYGFMQEPNVPRALHHIDRHMFPDEFNIKQATYFLSRERVVPTKGSGMWLWREKLYAFMHRNASEAADYFRLPAAQVMEIGSPVRI